MPSKGHKRNVPEHNKPANKGKEKKNKENGSNRTVDGIQEEDGVVKATANP